MSYKITPQNNMMDYRQYFVGLTSKHVKKDMNNSSISMTGRRILDCIVVCQYGRYHWVKNKTKNKSCSVWACVADDGTHFFMKGIVLRRIERVNALGETK